MGRVDKGGQVHTFALWAGIIAGCCVGLIGWALAQTLGLNAWKRAGMFVVCYSIGYITVGFVVEHL